MQPFFSLNLVFDGMAKRPGRTDPEEKQIDPGYDETAADPDAGKAVPDALPVRAALSHTPDLSSSLSSSEYREKLESAMFVTCATRN